MKLFKTLQQIQQELKVPKGQFNSFGNFYYRSCEDILTAFKPLEPKYKVVLVLNDDAVQVGENIFIKATATLHSTEDEEEISTTAFAMHSTNKKGMDDSQMTGTASSYARKYALNALFAIDDNKDADTDEFKKQTAKNEPSNSTRLDFDGVRSTLDAIDDEKSLDEYGAELKKKYPRMTPKQAQAISAMFNKRREELKQ